MNDDRRRWCGGFLQWMEPKVLFAGCVVLGALLSGCSGGTDAESPLAASEPAEAAVVEVPDWTGVWSMVGNTIFDRASVQPQGAGAGQPGVRLHPPLTEEWERRYQRNVELVAEGLFPDPITNCGIPVGFPRIMNVPDVYEFVVTPDQTWIVTENGPNILRIFTDGRDHPPAEELWPTYTGHSVGRWEGDTLVFETISLKKDGDTIMDRTGFELSGEMRATTRMRMIDEGMIEARMVFEDPVALTEPWEVVKQYRRLPEGTRVFDHACAENQRNPVGPDGRTLTVGPDGEILDDL